jgi:hypothetical protein
VTFSNHIFNSNPSQQGKFKWHLQRKVVVQQLPQNQNTQYLPKKQALDVAKIHASSQKMTKETKKHIVARVSN